ncbi:putative peroxiredoxin [Shimia sp. SK013]|uniref:peroxiredoxin family protein n=1 Tax=Shimia sp. SK013 TaxID=1389006 RepID=UPI0006B639D8|nr:peroxiredoxin family protein [Shimia sp. SK013]KPA21129.1 putative peroxiredoxin [Shimia sp. SK013]
MNTAAILTAMAGFAIVLISIILYFRTIPRGTVPEKVGGFATKLIIGVALSLIGVYLGLTGEGMAGALTYVLASLGIFFGGFILWVLTQRKTPIGEIKVAVGDNLLPFTSMTSEGAAFDSSELSGKRTLLKFFRGGWCPYCSAELVAFDAMKDELAKHDVSVLALSKDTPEQAEIHKTRDGLDFPLLSDPDLKIIRAYGVEHHKALGQTKNTKLTIGGVPVGLAPFKFEAMAIPTTLLIDETGTIRWVDQTDDYRLRSSSKRVLEAVKAAFG